MNKLQTFAAGQPMTKDFASFGRAHRQQFPYIIPPFKGQELSQINPRENPFFENGKMQCWLLREHGSVKGRSAAMINPNIPFSGGKLGLIGFFDVVEDKAMAFDLFDAAVEWLQKEGCTHCWAPVNFSIWHYYRFAVDHFEEIPFAGEPKNPPWYPEFAGAYGFQPLQHWDSWWVEKEGMELLIEQFRQQYQLFVKSGYRHEHFDKKRLNHFLRVVYEMVMHSFSDFLGFYPISFAEFEKLFAPMATILDGKCSIFARTPEGQYAAFLLGQRDLGKALTAMNGRKNLISLSRYWWHGNQREYANLSHGILLPGAKEMAYQQSMEQFGQKMSVSLATVYNTLTLVKKQGYNGFLFSLMHPKAANRRFIKDHISKQHRHVLYQLKI